ncbi:MAG TPA: hypothetical protein V6D12_22865 [Candidatus Obscuribacterales bacterium]
MFTKICQEVAQCQVSGFLADFLWASARYVFVYPINQKKCCSDRFRCGIYLEVKSLSTRSH